MDIDKIFIAAGLPIPDRRVGDQEQMLANCKRYITTMCSGSLTANLKGNYMTLLTIKGPLVRAVLEYYMKWIDIHGCLPDYYRRQSYSCGHRKKYFPSGSDNQSSLLSCLRRRTCHGYQWQRCCLLERTVA